MLARLHVVVASAAVALVVSGCYDLKATPIENPDAGDTDENQWEEPDLQWVQVIGGEGGERIRAVDVASNGKILVAGTAEIPSATYGVGYGYESDLDPGEPQVLETMGSCHSIMWAIYQPSGRLDTAGVLTGSGGCKQAFDGVFLPDGESFLLTGYYAGMINTGEELTEKSQAFSSTFSWDVFLARIGGGGQIEWIVDAGGMGSDLGNTTAVASGEALVGGYVSDDAVFGEGEPLEAAIAIGGEVQKGFIAAYDVDDGTLSWLASIDGTSEVTDVAAVLNDKWAVAGWFEGTATFGEGESAQTVSASGDEKDGFVAVYGSSGELEWVKTVEGAQTARVDSVAVLENGSVLAFGTYEVEADFAEGSEDDLSVDLTGGTNPGTDLFVAKYKYDGEFEWALHIGGEGSDTANDITTCDNDQSFIVTGSFSDSLILGRSGGSAQREKELASTHKDYTDAFLALYDVDGNLGWARREGGEHGEAGMAVAASSNAIVMAGYYEGGAVFGDIEEGEDAPADPITPQWWGNWDIFVARYRD